MKKFYAVSFLFAIISIVNLRLQAQTFKLLKDINTLTPSLPTNFTRTSSEYAILNGKAYFTADDGIHGQELWSTDGTHNTVMVKDINPGPEGSHVSYIYTYKNKLYFFATILEDGYKSALYTSDGTAEGTVLLKDSFGLTGFGGFPAEYTVMNGVLYFSAASLTSFDASALWRSDGTAAGTYQLVDFNNPEHNYKGDLHNFAVLDNKLFFTTGTGGTQELWYTEGTTANTKRFNYINSAFYLINKLTVLGNTLYMLADKTVYKTNGDSLSTKQINDPTTFSISSMQAFKDSIYFGAHNNYTSQSGLYTYNASFFNGLSLLKEFAAAPTLAVVLQNNQLFFTAADTSSSTPGLWVTDGTVANTKLLLHDTGGYSNFYSGYDRIYFSHSTSTYGEEPWNSDGSATGTYMVDDISNGIYSSQPSNFTQLNSFVLFAANNSERGIEMYRFEGQTIGLVKDINTTNTAYSWPSITAGQYDTINNHLFFWALDNVHGFEPWTTDGTTGGTMLLKDIQPGSLSGNGNIVVSPTSWAGTKLFPVNNRLNGYDYFYGISATVGWALYKTMGTPATTTFATSIATTPTGIKPEAISVANNKIFTIVNAEGTSQLFVYDGVNKPQLLKTGFTTINSTPDATNTFGDARNFYFFVDKQPEIELWKSDGTIDGTKMIKNLYPGQAYSSQIGGMINFKGEVFFVAASQYPGEYTWHLWKTDGTEAGTTMITKTQTTFAPNLTISNNKLYFVGTSTSTGTELWVTDGTNDGTYIVKDLAGPNSSNPSNLLDFKGSLYFVAYDNASAMWKTDGTDTGTVLVKKDCFSIAKGNDKLYFISNYKIWESDGTSAGLKMMDTTGLENLMPYNLIFANGRLYFLASPARYGLELYTTADKILPITLVTFSAQLHNKDALLQWSTVNEQNNSYFNVQRSTNGTSFTTIARVDAKNGIKKNDYDYTDARVTALGVDKLYYRLQQFDADGKFTYSKTIPLPINNKTLVTIGPNPATDVANVYSTINIPGAVVIITDMGGRVLYTVKQNIVAGSKTSIPLHGFAKGVYSVSIQAVNTPKQEFKLVIDK